MSDFTPQPDSWFRTRCRPTAATVAPKARLGIVAPKARLGIAAVAFGALLLTLAAPPAATAKKGKKKTAVVNGSVLDVKDQIAPGVRVTVINPAEPDVVVAETTSDDQGSFVLEIPEANGLYKVRLEGEGYAPFEADITLEAGLRQKAEFRLLDAATAAKQEAVKAFNDGIRAFNAKDLTTAKAKFREAAELDPEISEPHLGLADILLTEKDWAGAAEELEKFLALKPDDPRGLSLAYEAYRQLDNEAKLSEITGKMKGTDQAKNLAIQVYNEGVRATQRGNTTGAIEKFRNALELDPKMTVAYASLATLLYNREAYEGAEMMVEQLLELEPENVQARRLRYLIEDARNDDRSKADAALEAYMEVDPDGAADLLYQRADLDFRAGDPAGAEKALLRVLEIRPDLARAHYTLGLVYAQSDKDKARRHLEKFIELAPDDPEVSTAKEMLSYF